MCDREGATAFPTLFLYKDGAKFGAEYEGGRSLKDLQAFLLARTTGKAEAEDEEEEEEAEEVESGTYQTVSGHGEILLL